MRHLVVHSRPGRFAGWPANNGLWCWEGVEMLAAFTEGGFRELAGHNLVEPCRTRLARSMDQGDSWCLEPVMPFVANCQPTPPLDPIDFGAPGLALRVVGTAYHGSDCPTGAFYSSGDRGRTWAGPFALSGLAGCPELAGWEITARTDALVEGPHSCLLMLSARSDGWLTDRTFGARTRDGGRSFRFVGWVVPPWDPARAVMPATVCGPAGELLTTIRRRTPGEESCWIDAYRSADRGRSWTLPARVAETGRANGNPPALVRLDGGRFCCVYGDRDSRRMVARFSRDGGRSWGEEQVLRDDFQADRHDDPDLGYPRLVQRADGQLLAVYYWATRELPHQHIAATIWTP